MKGEEMHGIPSENDVNTMAEVARRVAQAIVQLVPLGGWLAAWVHAGRWLQRGFEAAAADPALIPPLDPELPALVESLCDDLEEKINDFVKRKNPEFHQAIVDKLNELGKSRPS